MATHTCMCGSDMAGKHHEACPTALEQDPNFPTQEEEKWREGFHYNQEAFKQAEMEEAQAKEYEEWLKANKPFGVYRTTPQYSCIHDGLIGTVSSPTTHWFATAEEAFAKIRSLSPEDMDDSSYDVYDIRTMNRVEPPFVVHQFTDSDNGEHWVSCPKNEATHTTTNCIDYEVHFLRRAGEEEWDDRKDSCWAVVYVISKQQEDLPF